MNMKCCSYQKDTAVVPWHVHNSILSSGRTLEAGKPTLHELCHVFQHDMGIFFHHHDISMCSVSLLEGNLLSFSTDVPLYFHKTSV